MPEPVERSDLPDSRHADPAVAAPGWRPARPGDTPGQLAPKLAGDLPEGSSLIPDAVWDRALEAGGLLAAVEIAYEAGKTAEVARVRAQTWAAARSVVEAIDFGASDALMQAVLRGFRDDVVIRMQVYETACRIEAGEPAESVVAALPDVVGTPDHPEERSA